MEDEARDAYTKVLISMGHKYVKVKTCGLYVCSTAMFLGASPDAVVCCSCCGSGVLEIKRPLSIAHSDPQTAGLTYLHSTTNGLKLKTTHMYYTQMQTQMGVTNSR